MVRIFTLCLSMALLVLGVAGVMQHAPTWLIVADFTAGTIGLGLDAFLWATQGHLSVLVAFGMATLLVVIFFVGIITGVAPWLAWSIFAIGVAFFAIGCARAFSRSMYAGDLEA